MLLTCDEIEASHESGELVIDPFCRENINTASYDVTLGPWFYRQAPWKGYYNPYSRQAIASSWMLCSAAPATEFLRVEGGIDPTDLVIPIEPKEIIIAHTLEFIGSVVQPNGSISITTQMHSRSSSVRNGIDVCGSGGFGDHGFCARWAMEIVNNSRTFTTYLVVGRRIAQISFHRTAPVYRNYALEGKYHAGKTVEQLKAEWTPELLLPKTYMDREVGQPAQHKDIIAKLVSLPE